METNRIFLALVLFVLLCYFNPVDGAPAEDLIKVLPGLTKQPYWKQYSGYLNATGNKKLHYWFLQSQSKQASDDPVVLWLNGGPGCSSIFGLLTEHGPFKINSNGKTVYSNEYSWNQVANMIYLEAPAGVGFSYSPDNDYKTDDDKVALDNYLAVKHFFKKFPEYRRNPFFVTGESYGGIYVPTLSARIVNDEDINFQGFAVGNGLSDREMNTDSLVYFTYYHGLIGDVLWDELLATCCNGNMIRCKFQQNSQKITACGNKVQKVMAIVFTGGLNKYNLYAPCIGLSGVSYDRKHRKTAFAYLNWPFIQYSPIQKQVKELQITADQENILRLTAPCLSYDQIISYMNSPDVRDALHIPKDVQDWDDCSATVRMEYTSLYSSVRDQYQKVLAYKKRILVYSGDVDMNYNYLGLEWFVDSLGLNITEERKAWHYTPMVGNKQVAGFVKQMDGVSLVTVLGAGHMVPTDKPGPALLMITNFLKNTPFN